MWTRRAGVGAPRFGFLKDFTAESAENAEFFWGSKDYGEWGEWANEANFLGGKRKP